MEKKTGFSDSFSQATGPLKKRDEKANRKVIKIDHSPFRSSNLSKELLDISKSEEIKNNVKTAVGMIKSRFTCKAHSKSNNKGNQESPGNKAV